MKGSFWPSSPPRLSRRCLDLLRESAIPLCTRPAAASSSTTGTAANALMMTLPLDDSIADLSPLSGRGADCAARLRVLRRCRCAARWLKRCRSGIRQHPPRGRPEPRFHQSRPAGPDLAPRPRSVELYRWGDCVVSQRSQRRGTVDEGPKRSRRKRRRSSGCATIWPPGIRTARSSMCGSGNCERPRSERGSGGLPLYDRPVAGGC